MKQLTSLEQLKGQTIVDIKISEVYSTMGIILENGQYTIIEIDRAYESCDDTIRISEETPDEDLLWEFGIITDEEHNTIVEARRAEWLIYQEKQERKEYEKLKAKFEDEDVS